MSHSCNDWRKKPQKTDKSKPLFKKRRPKKEILSGEEYERMDKFSSFSGGLYTQLM